MSAEILVVDASVAAKWLLPAENESLVDEANRLFVRYQEGLLDFLVPDWFWSEIGNLVLKAVRRERFGVSDGQAAIVAAGAWGFTTLSSRVFAARAYDIGVRYNRSFYDSIYAAMAVETQSTLITADERLANATAAYLPVKWLGAL